MYLDSGSYLRNDIKYLRNRGVMLCVAAVHARRCGEEEGGPLLSIPKDGGIRNKVGACSYDETFE
jgi:hypothetical protein